MSQFITNSRRLAINIRDEFRCAYCERDLRTVAPDQITLDHLQPQSMGGGHGSHNLVTCCKTCNSARKTQPWRVFAKRFYPAALTRIPNLRRRTVNMRLAQELIAGYGSTEKARKAIVR